MVQDGDSGFDLDCGGVSTLYMVSCVSKRFHMGARASMKARKYIISIAVAPRCANFGREGGHADKLTLKDDLVEIESKVYFTGNLSLI